MNRVITGAAAFLLLLAAGCSSDSEACDVIAQTGCDEGLVCEEVVGGDPACFGAVLLRGNVFDLANTNGIGGATVVALDANRAPASTVAVTSASGGYEIQVARQRDTDGNPQGGDVTLRADAARYQTFPGGVRQALPIDLSDPVDEDGGLVVQTIATDIGLIALPAGAGTNEIFGTAEVPEDGTGVLVVAETPGREGFTAVADRGGMYRIFNLPDGDFSVVGYAQGVNYVPGEASVSGGQDAEVDLTISGDAPGIVTGSVQIVNPEGGRGTSYILVVESTFDATLARGEAPPGLRAPEGAGFSEAGTWMIEGVPAGSYIVLGAFENDQLVRDPDFGQGNTEIVRVDVVAGQTVAADGFKITGALDVISPGAEGAEPVTEPLIFTWVDDSSEDRYLIDVFDSFGELIWSKADIPGSSSSNPQVPYEGPTLESGMYYQFRVTSFLNERPLARTEDLKGVFFLP